MKKSIFGNYISTIDRLLGLQARAEQVIADNNAPGIAAPAVPEEPAAPMAAPPAEPVALAAPLIAAALEVDMGPYGEEGKEEADLEQEEEEAEGAEDYDDNDDDDDDYDDDDAEQVNDKHDKDKDNDGKGTGGGGANGTSGGDNTDSTGPSGGGKGSSSSSGSSDNSKTNNYEPTDSTKYYVNKFTSYNYTDYRIADAGPILLLNDLVLKIEVCAKANLEAEKVSALNSMPKPTEITSHCLIADDVIMELQSLNEMHCSGVVVSTGVVAVLGSY